MHSGIEFIAYEGPPERRAAFEARIRRGHMIQMHVEAARLEMQREIAAARERGLVEGAAMAASSTARAGKGLWTWEEAAEFLNCTVSTLKKRVERGMYRSAIHNPHRGKRNGKKGGNRGRSMFVRSRLIEILGGAR